MIADADERIPDQSAPCTTPTKSSTTMLVMTPYAREKPQKASDATRSRRRRPTRSAIVPINGAEKALAKVEAERNQPAAAVEPPRSMMRNGMAGRSWNAE